MDSDEGTSAKTIGVAAAAWEFAIFTVVVRNATAVRRTITRASTKKIRMLNSSLGKRFAWFDDTDEMISKLKMRCLDFDFRHVTGSAIFVSDGTTRQGTLRCRFTFHSMTVRTLGVVVRWVLTE